MLITQPSTFAIRTSQHTDQKLQKSLSVSTADFADTKKLNLFRQRKRNTELKNYLKPLTDKNAQLVTRAKSKRAVSGNLKGIVTNKIYRSLTVLCFEMPASS